MLQQESTCAYTRTHVCTRLLVVAGAAWSTRRTARGWRFQAGALRPLTPVLPDGGWCSSPDNVSAPHLGTRCGNVCLGGPLADLLLPGARGWLKGRVFTSSSASGQLVGTFVLT